MLAREWFSAAELAEMALPGLPATERGVQLQAERLDWQRPEHEGKLWRRRQGRGGGVEFHWSLLPITARAKITLRFAPPAPTDARAAAKTRLSDAEMWAWFDRQPEKKKAIARHRLETLDAIEALVLNGTERLMAIRIIAEMRRISQSTIYNWLELVRCTPRSEWLPRLAPQHAGRAAEAECSAEAWEALVSDYLRPERPNASDCIRRVRELAAAKGWAVPSDRTLLRRLQALPPQVVTLKRHGEAALKRMLPAQSRDRGALHALQAVNADGHTWDVFVEWPDGTVGRPSMVAFQDIYSGLILSWRVDVSENWHAVRLAFGDLVERYGIPDECLLDNGRSFASKKLTGGTANRYRFKVRDEDPEGLLTALGVRVHWAQPYSGQSKPVERAFRDFAQGIAKHPRLAGAWTGNSPVNKPENRGQRAIKLAEFVEVVSQGIAEHNAREGRKSAVCRGRSFQQAFDESYAQAMIRKATAEQRRLWLLAAEAVTVRAQDGQIHFHGNRFWAEWLLPLRGRKVTVRFDPEFLQEPLHVYRLDGAYLGAAECQEAAGFFSIEDAQKQARKWRSFLRATKAAAEAEASLSIDELAALHTKTERAEPPPPPQPKIVRLLQGNAALRAQPVAAEEEDDQPSVDRLFTAAVAQMRAARTGQHLRVVPEEDPEPEA